MSEASALRSMVGFIEARGTFEKFLTEKLLLATMSALKNTVKSKTEWHVFIQDLAAGLNRGGLLSNNSEQLFREAAYEYVNASS